ncbi:hypothetical protein CC1G_09059 [Coprinopsis cinerea okayama7|uniref:Uncharacterized protein n=1 Tax=Coprinopsis cinerea (strain Okayama-7 / 130 / ATCC MYA-4618 / FGSC 9003) TaxID=240176 RepID=A8P2Z3_COPC7|nr:hypothetical protein CC1G_09059 [Coprinopsis cinerea okayama7\|eukprot:XP_001838431.2 hypothetical protein CC1G_09059 [Coprinopsis cinerea okayama7\
MASRAILDDRNPAIQYLGAWERGGEPEEHAGTSTYTKSANSTVELSFHASGIRIIGTVDYAQDSHPNPISSYTLDETSEFRFAPQLQANKTFNVTFFEASGLQIREHQLVIRNEVQGAMLALDQVILINPECSYSFNYTKHTATTRNQTVDSGAPLRGKTTSPIPAIVGGTLGCLIFVSVLGVLLKACYKARGVTMAFQHVEQLSTTSPA